MTQEQTILVLGGGVGGLHLFAGGEEVPPATTAPRRLAS
jgi:hypothetical protein